MIPYRGNRFGLNRTQGTTISYLESTGTQWVDTGLHAATGYLYRAKISPTSSGTWRIFWGRQQTVTGSAPEFFGFGSSATKIAAFFSGAGAATGETSVITGEQYTIELLSTPPDKYVTINGVTSTRTYTGGYSAHNVYLFGLNNAGSATSANLASVRVYYWQAYDGSTLVRDLWPALDQGVACMYDRVSDQYFYNQGSGTFLYG